MSYAAHLTKHGGMATCGEHLGVMVAPANAIAGCPPGWIFVDLKRATEAIVREALDHAKQGHSTWPDKENGSRPKCEPPKSKVPVGIHRIDS